MIFVILNIFFVPARLKPCGAKATWMFINFKCEEDREEGKIQKFISLFPQIGVVVYHFLL